ncbi:MAG: RNA polymerase sigma factor [Dokdonia sp.]|jgi:RNA polymerase sigma-70 factor (ECF subfamily)
MITEQEFTRSYNLYSAKVYRLCLGYASGNHDLAKDWHQQAFIKVWKHRNSFKAQSSIDTWIYRIAVNVCLGDLRKSKKDLSVKEELLSPLPESESAPIDTEENVQRLYRCIDLLNKQNKALILLELEDIPQATIAASLGLAHGTVRTRLSRIRKSLLKCIKNEK